MLMALIKGSKAVIGSVKCLDRSRDGMQQLLPKKQDGCVYVHIYTVYVAIHRYICMYVYTNLPLY